MTWYELKHRVIQILLSRNLADPSIRINALNNLEGIFSSHFPSIINNPFVILNYDKNEFKNKISEHKINKTLNSAESSVINNFYQLLSGNSIKGINGQTGTNSIDDISFSDDNFPIIKKFPNEYDFLIKLFNKQIVNRNTTRLNEIHIKTEQLWEQQLNNIPGKEIKYLLIAEAPPWSQQGDVFYVYNPNSSPRTLLRAITKAFFDVFIYKQIGIESTLNALTDLGFIIIDSLPFSMEYSNKRGRKNYKELVEHCSETYLIRKLNHSGINWHPELKIAFSVKRNAIILINKFAGDIPITSLKKKIKVNDSLIAVNNAGYPSSDKLKQIYNL